MSDPNGKRRTLQADYVSPTGKQTITYPLLDVPDAETSTADKSAYLADLRIKITKLQDEVNAFLTAKMDEDKANETKTSRGVGKVVDEAREEDMYGEENPEDDS